MLDKEFKDVIGTTKEITGDRDKTETADGGRRKTNIDILLDALDSDYTMRVGTDGAATLESVKRNLPDTAASAGSFINLHPQKAAETRQRKPKLTNGNLQFSPVINSVYL